jgi:hypothetical protein
MDVKLLVLSGPYHCSRWFFHTLTPLLPAQVVNDVMRSCKEISRYEYLKERVLAECNKLLTDKQREASEFVQNIINMEVAAGPRTAARAAVVCTGAWGSDGCEETLRPVRCAVSAERRPLRAQVAYLNTDNPEFDTCAPPPSLPPLSETLR